MSHIPNSAIPHAAPAVETVTDANGTASSLFSQFTGTIREHPRTAIAAGAAVAAGVAAAAAIGRSRATRSRASAKTRKN